MRWLRRAGLALGVAFALLLLFVAFKFLDSGAWRYVLLAHPGRPLIKAGFPAIKDWSTLEIRLRRTFCLGTCPDYEVRIKGDGTVLFSGRDYVSIAGVHRTHIPMESVRALVHLFQAADFFWTYEQNYGSNVDASQDVIEIAFDGRKKTARNVGDLEDLWALEHAVDETAGTARWVTGKGGTLAVLMAENLEEDIPPERQIDAAVKREDWTLVDQRLAGLAGKSLTGCMALSAAADQGNIQAVNRLIAAGAPVQWDVVRAGRKIVCDALDWAARSGLPQIVAAILAEHPDVNIRGWDGGTPLVHTLSLSKAGPDGKQGEIVKMLLAAGADVNARDQHGQSAIMFAQNSYVAAQELLKAGAVDLNKFDVAGETVLMKATPLVANLLHYRGAIAPSASQEIWDWDKRFHESDAGNAQDLGSNPPSIK